MTSAAKITTSEEENNPNIVRYCDLIPCRNAFIDTRSPGSDRKENFTIIGPGVSENPEQHIHIARPHGFNIGGARQPPNCLNSQHSHLTAEVFFVHSGKWSFNLGEFGDDAKIALKPGDLISIPTNLFRGFENIGEDKGFLWAILGGDDPGKVLWAPSVFKLAQQYGLILLENGQLIDRNKGETIPDGMRPMPVTSKKQVQKLQQFDNVQLRQCCIFANESAAEIIEDEVRIRPLIGASTKLNWEHGFIVDQLKLSGDIKSEAETYPHPEVIFVHSGTLQIYIGDDIWELGAGDTATLPENAPRAYANIHKDELDFLRVRGLQ